MSSVGPDDYGIFLGARRSALARRGEAPVWHAHDDAASWLFSLQRQLRPHRWLPRGSLTVWLSSAFARPFVLPGSTGARSHAELETLACRVGATSTGLHAACTAWIELVSGDRERLGVVMPTDLRRTIAGTASGARLRLQSIRPWWASAQNSLCEKSPALRMASVRDDDGHVLLSSKGDRWLGAHCQVPAPGDAEIDAMVTRLRFSTETLPDSCGAVRLLGQETVVDRSSTAWLGPLPSFSP